ncbi:hypothetical protein KCU95_g8779, partial [Aureobasidium melanogenum]
MSAPPQSPHSHTAYAEDSEDDIEVLVFKNSGRANNTISTTTVNTNKERNNKPTAHTSIKREPSQKPFAPEDKMAHTDPHEKTLDQRRHDLLQMPSAPANNSTDDQIKQFASNDAVRSTTPINLTTHTARSTSRTQTPDEFANITSSFSTRVSKSNPSHIALFKTLSPSQSLGRKRKLTKIRNKLKEKTVDELTQIYNSTDDPDFRKLMSEVYYENCMQRLDDWERKL